MRILDTQKKKILIAMTNAFFMQKGCYVENSPPVAYAEWGPMILHNREVIFVNLNAYDDYLDAQFVYQYSHELMHFHNSKFELPVKTKWFDELLCANISFYLLEIFENPFFLNYINCCSPKTPIFSPTDAKILISTNLKQYWEVSDAVYRNQINLKNFIYLNRDAINIWQLAKAFSEFNEQNSKNENKKGLSDFVNEISDERLSEFLKSFMPLNELEK